MATEKPTPPDGATKVVSESNQDDGDDLELSPGEEVVGRVVNITPKETEWGQSAVLTLELEESGELKDYFCKDEAKKAYKEGSIQKGATYWIAKMPKEEEINDGEATYYPTDFQLIEEAA